MIICFMKGFSSTFQIFNFPLFAYISIYKSVSIMRYSVPIIANLSKETVIFFLWLKYLKVEGQSQESGTGAFSTMDLLFAKL